MQRNDIALELQGKQTLRESPTMCKQASMEQTKSNCNSSILTPWEKVSMQEVRAGAGTGDQTLHAGTTTSRDQHE